MRTITRMLMIGLVVACVLAMVPNQVRASENCQDTNEAKTLQIVVTYAGYLDLDNGGSCNDVMTSFQIRVLSEEISFHNTRIYCFLTLPSGMTFSMAMAWKGRYSSLTLVIAWLNVATESGWYALTACAILLGGPGDYYALSVVAFDPPTGGDPGPPLVELMSAEMLP